MEERNATKHRLVERTTHFPGIIPRGPEILLSKILKPEKTLGFQMRQHAGNRYAMGGEKLCQGGIVSVLFFLPKITHENHGAFGRANTIEVPA